MSRKTSRITTKKEAALPLPEYYSIFFIPGSFRSSQVMAAQLSVSNAVEQLMAEGILYENESGTITAKLPRIEGVNIEIDISGSNAGVYYKVIPFIT